MRSYVCSLELCGNRMYDRMFENVDFMVLWCGVAWCGVCVIVPGTPWDGSVGKQLFFVWYGTFQSAGAPQKVEKSLTERRYGGHTAQLCYIVRCQDQKMGV